MICFFLGDFKNIQIYTVWWNSLKMKTEQYYFQAPVRFRPFVIAQHSSMKDTEPKRCRPLCVSHLRSHMCVIQGCSTRSQPADWYMANWLRGSHADHGDSRESGSLQSLLQNGQRRQRVCSPPASPGDPPHTGYKKKERLTKRFRLSSCQSSIHQCWGDKFCLTKPVITTRALQNKSFVVAPFVGWYNKLHKTLCQVALLHDESRVTISCRVQNYWYFFFPSSLHRTEAGRSSLIYFAKGKTTSPSRLLRYPVFTTHINILNSCLGDGWFKARTTVATLPQKTLW